MLEIVKQTKNDQLNQTEKQLNIKLPKVNQPLISTEGEIHLKMDKSFIRDEGVFNVPSVNTFLGGIVTMPKDLPVIKISVLLDRGN